MWRWVLTEVDPVNLPPVLTSGGVLDPDALRADIEHLKWVLFQTRERTGGGVDIIGDSAEDIAANTAAIIVNAANIAINAAAILVNAADIATNTTNITTNSLAITDLEMSENTSLIGQIAFLKARINEFEMMPTKNDTPVLLSRINDIELQLARASEIPILSQRISDLELQQ